MAETHMPTGMKLLPPAKDVCQECAVNHDPTHPHNAQSLYYQYSFYTKHGRWPTWGDAMAHCPDDMKAAWTSALASRGVDVSGGKINPAKENPNV